MRRITPEVFTIYFFCYMMKKAPFNLVARTVRMDNPDRNPRCFCKAQHIDADNIASVVVEYIKMVFFEKARPEFPIVDIVVPIRRAIPNFTVQFHVGKAVNDFIFFRKLPAKISDVRFYAAFVRAKSNH